MQRPLYIISRILPCSYNQRRMAVIALCIREQEQKSEKWLITVKNMGCSIKDDKKTSVDLQMLFNEL